MIYGREPVTPESLVISLVVILLVVIVACGSHWLDNRKK
jgi:hypothetical protein